MNNFPIVKASKQSLRQRKLVFGVGTNDADYMVTRKVGGKQAMCHTYQAWLNMLERCYYKRYQEKFPAYVGCSSCNEWLLFSNFKAWMDSQDCECKELDKDILIQGNKIYSPSTCIFVTKEINLLLTNSAAIRGAYPQGVSLHKQGKYKVSCRVNGASKYLGLFESVIDASEAYKSFKYELIRGIAIKQSEPLKSALLAYRL